MIAEQFLELLRAGLWNRNAQTVLFQDDKTNWNVIYQLAQQQTVTGIVYDGWQTLPTSLHPSRALAIQWAGQVARAEEDNEHLNKVTVDLFSLYQKAGLHPVLLKGQGVASFYPNPKRRLCGDIDVYLGNEEIKTANKVLIDAGGEAINMSYFKHSSLWFQGIKIDNHRIIGKLHNPFANRFYQKWSACHLPKKTNSIILNGKDIQIPDATFNAIFLFLHAFGHFQSGGIGFRHICDWAKTISVCHKEINFNEVAFFFKNTHLKRAFKAFSFVAIQCAGMNKNLLSIDFNNKDKKLGQQLLKEIFKGGNFGKYNTTVPQRPPGYWAGKWHSFNVIVRRNMKLRHFSPSEAFWLPVGLIRNSLITQIKRIWP